MLRPPALPAQDTERIRNRLRHNAAAFRMSLAVQTAAAGASRIG